MNLSSDIGGAGKLLLIRARIGSGVIWWFDDGAGGFARVDGAWGCVEGFAG